MQNSAGVIARYRQYLPVTDETPVISLSEGDTPLIKLNNIVKNLPIELNLYAKFEGLNPTGSFKDRGMVMAVSKAKEEGSNAVICASTGNTSAAAAAYAARAGMQAFVLIPEGKIALGKLAQAQIYGATVIQIKGNFDEGLSIVKEIANTTPITIVNSLNPYRLQGQKTAAFEIIDMLGDAPDYHCLPIGNGGNITSYWMGYQEYFKLKKSSQLPKILGFQAAGAAPLIKGHTVAQPETLATAIRIGNPQYGEQAKQAAQDSGGYLGALEDKAILHAQALLAKCEGIFCEPASAAGLAGLLQAISANQIPSGSNIVCTLTGHGLKDPDIVQCHHNLELKTAAAEFAAVQAIIHEKL